ncbi:hypothetical protein A4A49_12073 [Nicotiana attenuata]|uniref:Uncharacterized protein n=1 Tax=Nicotiana attenuata TaxID=49451 RepID=A0A314L6E7_NICAT|nr:hypothetical protein A4A49_12073 [Nicotiana attenuata]
MVYSKSKCRHEHLGCTGLQFRRCLAGSQGAHACIYSWNSSILYPLPIAVITSAAQGRRGNFVYYLMAIGTNLSKNPYLFFSRCGLAKRWGHIDVS